ncbi:MAG: family 16 glycoside hydrolase [Candidatus Brocadiia bacterium]
MKKLLSALVVSVLAVTAALAGDDNLAEAFFKSGLTQLSQNNFEEAISKFNKALTYRAEYPEALYRLGEAYEKNKQVKKSLAPYRKCQRLLTLKSGRTKDEDELFLLAAKALERTDTASRQLTKVRGAYMSGLLNLANDYANRKYPRFAGRVLQRILDIEPNHKGAQELMTKLQLAPMPVAQPNSKPEDKKPAAKGKPEKIFNGKDISNWSVAGNQQEYQNWRIESGQLVGGSKMANLECYLIWKGSLPENYKISVKFNVERTYTVYTNHAGLVYATSDAYQSIQINSNDSGTNGTLAFIKQDGKCKALLNGKVINDNIMMSGTPVVGLMTRNSHVFFSNITVEELK